MLSDRFKKYVIDMFLSDHSENSRYESGPPVKLIKELEHGYLVLSDFEISDEDIPVLSRFFRTKQVSVLFSIIAHFITTQYYFMIIRLVNKSLELK